MKQILQRYKDLQDIIAILGIDELSDEDKLPSRARARSNGSSRSRSTSPSSSPGFKGKYVKLADTMRSFKEIVDGKHDEIPEQAFYMKGTIDDVLERAEQMKGKGPRWPTRSNSKSRRRNTSLVREQAVRAQIPARMAIWASCRVTPRCSASSVSEP